MLICPERRQFTTSNQKVLPLDNTLRVTLAVSQMSIKHKHWILGTHRAVSRSAAALMWPHRQSCQSARPCLWLIIALWAITDQRMDSCPWTKRPVCLYGRTPANLTVRPGRLPDFLRPCPPVASSVLLQRASATRLTCLPVLFGLNAAVPLPASWTGLTEVS